MVGGMNLIDFKLFKVNKQCNWKDCKKDSTTKLVVNGIKKHYCNEHLRDVIEF